MRNAGARLVRTFLVAIVSLIIAIGVGAAAVTKVGA